MTARAALLFALLFAAPRALSQAWSDPGFGLGGHLSLSHASGAVSSAFSGGLQARVRLTGALGVEALVSYRQERYESGDTVVRVMEVPVQGSVQLFFFFRTPVQPYLSAGGGYYYVRSTDADGTTRVGKFGFHGGAGLDVHVAHRTSVFGDLRYVLLDIDAVRALDKRSDFWQAIAGATISF
jgi:outer membrane protein W